MALPREVADLFQPERALAADKWERWLAQEETRAVLRLLRLAEARHRYSADYTDAFVRLNRADGLVEAIQIIERRGKQEE